MTEPLQTVLGFDFGLKRIGVAVGQTVTASANPLTVVQAKNGVPNWEEIAGLLQVWQPGALVVGVPLNMDGTEQPITLAARQFAQSLRERYQLPVHEVDERLSTKAAREHLFKERGFSGLQKASVDSFAAVLILQSWLQNRRKKSNS